jgi:hypothetical protein
LVSEIIMVLRLWDFSPSGFPRFFCFWDSKIFILLRFQDFSPSEI